MTHTPTSPSSSPISLPKGGGAIQGIGETFQPNLFTGTGNFTLPIFTSSGRDGFGPQLSLQYSSGNGNGIFGLGWNLSIPRITRKTEKGLPAYNNKDVFILSGAEDLVPKLKDNDPQPIDSEEITHNNGQEAVKYRVCRYLPRTEGLFARIESWEQVDEQDNNKVIDTFWRVTTKENITSIYGRTPAARITDPEDESRIFEWLLEETFDAKGNHISYEYAIDDTQLQISQLYEQNRNYAQVYPRRILYGNVPDQLRDFNGNTFTASVSKQGADHRQPFSRINRNYIYEVVFDYGDWQHPRKSNNKFVYQPITASQERLNNSVPIREDAFSSFRPGFELRTMRRCSSVLMIHHFKELGGPTLVKSTDFEYATSTGTKVSLLTGATVTGYTKSTNNQYIFESMPPVEFKYSEFRPKAQKYQTVKAKNGNLPSVSLKDPNTAMVDLFGNGLQDIVQTTTGGFRYWRNKGNAELESPHTFHESPAGLSLADTGISFGDMGGDGLTDLIVHQGSVKGFFELQAEREVDGQLSGGWSPQSFRHFDDQPSINPADPNLRSLDLTGDGLTDLLVTTDQYFFWYQNKGKEGYAKPKAVPKPEGLENFSFNDPSGRVRLADMSGDGLHDIVLVHNGSIAYWPNLGYGQFGKCISMSGDTRLPRDFNPQRLFLADLDGSGTADLVYVDFNEVHFWFNQSGNQWSEKQTISGTPLTVDTASLTFTDFYGTGTTCLLWSYDFGTFLDGNYKVLDFCGGKKPYLLTEMNNNLGATTKVRYASSTRFYLEDLAKGNFWATPLPFPVQVIEKTESIDHISKTKLVTCYQYHHGFYDGREREFRGFGRVDQIDTEFFDIFEKNDLHENVDFENKVKAYHVPPVETRTWFHTGAYFEDKDITDRYRSEYLGGVEQLDSHQGPRDHEAFDIGNHQLDLSGDAPVTEAYRALRGAVLRTEVYAHDNSSDQNFPYLVTEQTYRVQTMQGKGSNAHAVFLTTSKESISYHYERQHNGQALADPRIQHNITISTDVYGNPLKSASITYKRRQSNFPEQQHDLIFFAINEYVNPLHTLADFRHSTLVSTSQYQLSGLSRITEEAYKTPEIDSAFSQAQDIGYEEKHTTGQLQKRKLKHQITLYWKDDLSSAVLGGDIGFHGLPYETYQLVLTPGLRQTIYGNTRLTNAMGAAGGYREQSDNQWGSAGQGDWWIPSGVQTFVPEQFFLPTETTDPFGNTTRIQYDPYHLFPSRTEDPLNNIQESLTDYRVLQPYLVRDINGNYSEVAFNALGLVVGSAVMGKAGRSPDQSLLGIDYSTIAQMRTNTEADSLEGFDPELTVNQVKDFMTNPDGDNQSAYAATHIRTALKKATSRVIYDFHRYHLDKNPVGICTISREIHHKDENNPTSLQLSYAYSDGFGREIQQKVQAEPDSAGTRRWVTSGWTIFNNKGKPVQQYEPFFSLTQHYEPYHKAGVTATVFYDPLERVICTLHPDDTYEKVVFDPWQQTTWDRNDTVLLEPQHEPDVKGYVAAHIANLSGFQTWFKQRIPDLNNLPATLTAPQQAALKTAEHADTPTIAHLDVQGNVFLTIADNKTETLQTRVELDIEGNELSITDPRGIQAFEHTFDMAGRKLRIHSKDAGNKLLLVAADNLPLYQWDANGNRVNTHYDALRRPAEVRIQKTGIPHFIAEKIIYGEEKPQPESTNARGNMWKHYDGAGLVTTSGIDFKGNLLEVQRTLLSDGTLTEIQWPQGTSGNFDESAAQNLLQTNTRLNTPAYVLKTRYDAMNRVVENHLPDGTVQIPAYNQASLLESLSIQHPNQSPEIFVRNIDYNAKGQREKIEYGNGVTTTYAYDTDTFRLEKMLSTRNNPTPKKLQELSYTYDPVGNITSIRDDAHPTLFNRNQAVDPESRYSYDAIYRLVEANGREHESMTACHYQTTGKKHTEFLPLPQPTTNAQALLNYIQKFQYDKAGNIERIEHSNSLGTTVRNQTYATQSNRLIMSSAGCTNENNAIPHDANGNILQLPHLEEMIWDYKNQLVEVQLNAGTHPDKAYYQYDSQGQRMRKTVVKNNGSRVAERIYLGDYEIYTETVANTLQKQRDTLHIKDDQSRIVIIEQEKDTGNPTQITSENIRYQLTNHLGSGVLELDENAQLISYEEYYPYGGTAYTTGRNQAETSLKRYRYSDKERDDETGLYYYGARYYAPWMGRWCSCDPLLNIDNINLYLFTLSNPIKNVDIQGFKSKPNLEAQKSKVVGEKTETSQVISNPETGYAINIEPNTGIIQVKEGDWLTKANAALTGSTDPEDAAENFEIFLDDEWVSFGTGLNVNYLEVGDKIRFKDFARENDPEAHVKKDELKLYGGGIDKQNQSVKGFFGIDKEKNGVGVKAFRAEGEAGLGGTSGSVNLAGVKFKVPIGAADLDVALDTPKASAGIYLGRTNETPSGDIESTYGIEALGSILELGAGSKTDDGMVGGGGSIGLGAGAKVKGIFRSDAEGIKSITLDLEGKFIGGGNLQYTIPLRINGKEQ